MNSETPEAAIHLSLEDTDPHPKIVVIHFPFQMCAERRVHIELEPFWEYTRYWAKTQGYPKEEGHYQHCPPT
jgi:hypothetical protein